MAITEREMLLLIEDRMYDVIEALINSNSLLKIDRASLDADELIQVAQLKSKQDKFDSIPITEELEPVSENQSDIGYEGGSKKKPSGGKSSKN